MNAGDVQNFYDKLFLLEPDTGSNIGGANVNMYNPWFTKYWEEAFECSFEAGTCDLPNQRLEDKIERSEAYVPFTLMAVDAIIRGVKAAAERRCGNIHVCSNLLNPDNSRGNDLYNCKLHFDSFCILFLLSFSFPLHFHLYEIWNDDLPSFDLNEHLSSSSLHTISLT